MSDSKTLDHVDYDALDSAKNAFIDACKRTLNFASDFGFIPDGRLGASANVFQLNLKPFLEAGAENLNITLLPEGLGTADDARPEDLSDEELQQFWYNIGIKTVSVMTNDAASSGMQTILISLYLPTSTPELLADPNFLKGFLNGFVDGCEKVGCVYFSGETPQLKTKIYPDKLDIAGALFGLMPPGVPPVDGSNIAAGNKMVFIQSTGPNENGFTSLRGLAEELPGGYRTKLPSGQEYWQAINNPSVLYTPIIQDLFKAGVHPTNIEPISGHGWQKIMRSKKPLRYVIEEMLPVTEVFQFVSEHSKTPMNEMIKIFNCGLGMVIFVESDEDAQKVIEVCEKHKLNAIAGGHLEEAPAREIVVKPLDTVLSSESFLLQQ
ncbi:MAG: AIR synthase related protein [Candidatus Gracilibacteria bacterium]|nr:AIR synthase related protein [Candidatus Gracilibacteria bacterium]